MEDIMNVVRDEKAGVAEKYRAMYKLKETEGEEGRLGLVEALGCTKSVLLLHEICFALGQRGDEASVAELTRVAHDMDHDEVTRHEAAEALGAIGSQTSLEALEALAKSDPSQPVRETCQLAVERIRLLASDPSEFETKSRFTSVDPTPSFKNNTPPALKGDDQDAVVTELGRILSEDPSLFDRYRAMFSLRNIGTEKAVAKICEALLKDETSALLRHELAYVLGQLELGSTTEPLVESLSRESEHPMVRHESAEALGAVGSPGALEAVSRFADHPAPLVAESCVVATDMARYWADWKPT